MSQRGFARHKAGLSMQPAGLICAPQRYRAQQVLLANHFHLFCRMPANGTLRAAPRLPLSLVATQASPRGFHWWWFTGESRPHQRVV
jgi:hypothetical protein